VLKQRDHLNQMPIATKSGKIEISKEIETAELAKKLTKIIKKGDVVFFYGEIGVGKTTFIRHLINNFQINNNLTLTEVTSPTFNIVNEYEVNDLVIQHFDLFRLKNENETKNIGLLENSSKIITLIEWPKIIKKKPINVIELYFEYGKDLETRFLSINGLDKKKINELR
jgi:tRNA threonylcarbamoyladenosine biosynthesis protein TsaE